MTTGWIAPLLLASTFLAAGATAHVLVAPSPDLEAYVACKTRVTDDVRNCEAELACGAVDTRTDLERDLCRRLTYGRA